MVRKQAENRASLELCPEASRRLRRATRPARNLRETLKNSISLKEIEDMKLAFERAAHEVKRGKQELEVAEVMCQLKESELALAEQQVARRTILSPADGIVSTIDRQAGEWVQPGERVFCESCGSTCCGPKVSSTRARRIDNIAGATVTVTVDRSVEQTADL